MIHVLKKYNIWFLIKKNSTVWKAFENPGMDNGPIKY